MAKHNDCYDFIDAYLQYCSDDIVLVAVDANVRYLMAQQGAEGYNVGQPAIASTDINANYNQS